jgi:cytochrome P450
VNEGYKRYPDKPFVVHTTNLTRLVIPQRYATETRNWADTRLSHKIALLDRFMSRYTGMDEVRDGTTHRDVVKVQLTQNLRVLLPTMKEEAERHLHPALDAADGKGSAMVNGFELALNTISHITSRIIVDDPLSRNEEWLRTLVKYPGDAAALSMELRRQPPYLRPLLYKFLKSTQIVKKDLAVVEALITPIINARRSSGNRDDHLDLVRWVTDIEPHATPKRLVGIILFLVIAAIHTSTFSLTHALYDLCAMPDLRKELREEAETVLKDGWTNTALHRLQKMDSFLKESHRANSLGVCTSCPPFTVSTFYADCWLVNYNRLLLQDITLTDGVRLPAGVIVCTAGAARSKDPLLYANPSQFNALRYFNEAKVSNDPSKLLFTSTSQGDSWFGYGWQACPGRWYAESQIKLILAILLTGYEFGFPDGQSERPSNFEADEKILPSTTQNITFQRR